MVVKLDWATLTRRRVPDLARPGGLGGAGRPGLAATPTTTRLAWPGGRLADLAGGQVLEVVTLSGPRPGAGLALALPDATT